MARGLLPRTLRSSGAALVGLFLCAGCATERATRSDCATMSWSGTCRLRDVRKIEDRDLPIPYVVYEAIYTPQPNGPGAQYVPPEVRLKFGAPGQYEFALQDHLKAQATVACESPPIQGSCVPDGLVAHVQPFDPERAAALAPAHATGCAAIEAASEQDRVNLSRHAAASIPERFVFALDSSSLSPDATTIATAVVKQMQDDPSIECVGLVGQITPGESASLAEARAHAIKELLVSLGVSRGRLLTIAVTASVFGAGSKPEDVDPSTRRVALSVLLQTQAAIAK